jgi:intracellular multiplication protein IcmG
MDDKKFTTENEIENQIEDSTKNHIDEFDQFNFTDDFPDEFSEEFMNKKLDENTEAATDFDEEIFTPPATDIDDDFLSDTQDTTGAVTPPPPAEKRGNLLKRHPWITLILVVLMIYGGYKFMQNSGSGEITPVAQTSTPKAVTKVQNLPVKSGETLQLGERLDSLEQSMRTVSTQLTEMQRAGARLNQMEQMVTKIAEEERGLAAILLRLDALNKQVTALTSLDQRLNALEAQMGVIATEVELHITVAEQTQRAANLSRQAMQAKSMIPVPMVVQAAIPGRAWLLSQTGELLTVARGDDVPGYGRVMNIDPIVGTVTMSSETVFREEE